MNDEKKSKKKPETRNYPANPNRTPALMPDEERARAAAGKAGELYAWELLDKADRAHVPSGKLIVRANKILDGEARARVIGEIRELRDRYAGTKAEYKAPNGEASLLLESLG
ncbi:MAG: hypothetical protein LBF78_13790, partial [Treponema sp.]|nr:hypothetical protein [Treponema sp.]